MADTKIRDTEETVWNVLTSFGYTEEDEFCEKSRYFILDKNEAAIVTKSTKKARAEAVAACVESAFALGCESFFVKICEKSVFDTLVLFGFSKILVFDEVKEGDFVLFSGDTVFAHGVFDEKKTVARIDIKKLCAVCKVGGETGEVSKSLVFAEENADGVAYDICYTLRVNGCIVEMYCDSGDINSAESYAKNEGHSAIIRCLPDGCVEIKDLLKNEIIKTTASEFLGYYEEDECDCGHDHEHHDCDCGHHHG